jgi:hypothetical protein
MRLVQPRPDDEPIRVQRALVERIERLWQKGVINGQLLEKARAGDYIVVIDFEADRYTIGLHDRAPFASLVKPDCEDERLLAMTRGQPPRAEGETVAVWFFASEWVDGRPVAEIHGPLRAWRDAKDNA